MMDARPVGDYVNVSTTPRAIGATGPTARVAPTVVIAVVMVVILCIGYVAAVVVGATLEVARLEVATVAAGQNDAITHHSPAVAPDAANIDNADMSYSPAAIPIGIANACAAPTVLSGAINGASLTQAGLLYRDQVVGACGLSPTSCATASAAPHPYQKFDFTNASSDAQCVSATIDARACGNDVYSAAYTGSFNAANVCTNYLAGMGLSTSGVFTYSFLAPANGAFSVVNSAVYTNALCNSYTLTLRPCSANVNATAALALSGPSHVSANANGTAVITYNLSYKNTGNYTIVVPSASVVMTPLVQSPGQNVVVLDYAHAGGMIAPGKTLTEDVAVIATSSARSQCLPTTYTLATQLGVGASVYQCNWGNPSQQTLTGQNLATQIFTGSVQPNAWLGEDRYAFSAQAGWNVTITVNTAYQATTFDPKICVSATPQGACLPGFSADDSFVCDFQPNYSTSTWPYCPMISGVLPATPEGMYYLRVSSYSASMFAGSIGQYRAMIQLATPNTALCPAILVLDNGFRSFLGPAGNQPQAVAVSSASFNATSPPVVVSVPPLNSLGSSCRQLILPLVSR